MFTCRQACMNVYEYMLYIYEYMNVIYEYMYAYLCMYVLCMCVARYVRVYVYFI